MRRPDVAIGVNCETIWYTLGLGDSSEHGLIRYVASFCIKVVAKDFVLQGVGVVHDFVIRTPS